MADPEDIPRRVSLMLADVERGLDEYEAEIERYRAFILAWRERKLAFRCVQRLGAEE